MRLPRKDSGEFDDPAFLARLRQGDPLAYQRLIRRFHASLVGVAAAIIGSHAQGEEVVQDAWLAVHASIGRFEGRSSLITWLFSIVLNRARTRAVRESRLVSLQMTDGGDPEERAVPLSAFQPDGHWVEAPRLWDEVNPERIVGGRQLWDHVLQAIERLPAGQRAVLILRDIEQCAAEEACALLEISAENQRVLLHRARGRIRATVDSLIDAAPAVAARTTSARPNGRGAARSQAHRSATHGCWLAGCWLGCAGVQRASRAGYGQRNRPDVQSSDVIESPRKEKRPRGNDMATKQGKPAAPSARKAIATRKPAPSAAAPPMAAPIVGAPPMAAPIVGAPPMAAPIVAAPIVGAPIVAAPAAPVQSAADNSQRLLREAAWSRMFGRTEAKNPFGRSRQAKP